MATQVFLGENVQVTIAGTKGDGGSLDLIADGDIEVTIEKSEIEKKVRGFSAVSHVLSKRVNITGSIDGISKNGDLWADAIGWFIGSADAIGDTIEITAIKNQPALQITFDELGTGESGTTQSSWKLNDVQVKSLKVSYPEEDVVKVTLDFGANGMEKV